MEFASVYILEAPYHADREYDYFVPPEFDGVTVGSAVTVPFGRSNRKTAAIVVALKSEAERDNVKPISSVTRRDLLSAEMISLAGFMREHTLCTFGDAVRAMIPTFALSKICEYYRAADVSLDGIGERAGMIVSYIAARGKVSAAAVKREFGAEAQSALNDLVRAGALIREREDSSGDQVRRRLVLSLKITPEDAERIADGRDPANRLRSTAQAAMLRALAAHGDGSVTLDELVQECPDADRVRARALERRGLVALSEEEVRRDPYMGRAVRHCELPPLTDEQTAAVATLSELYSSGEPRAALLHGVTGSGKTRVIIEMIRRVSADGRGAIVLVPEIALTPQTVGVFVSEFGDRVAVMHSQLSSGERFDAWRRIRSGDADVVIGTRSAVFAPVRRLGMIVIDEEQEHTYKSDISPKYLAHDIARKRCADNGALMLLASATPSLGSYYKAKCGTYTLVELKHRCNGGALPEVVICDTRREFLEGNTSPYGAELRQRLVDNTAAGMQSIVFLNRRGYSSILTCRSCGEPVKCPHCSVSLTYHTHKHLRDGEGEDYIRRRAESGNLTCHYCGFTAPVPSVCPECASPHLAFMGYGTQRAEDELCSMLPEGSVIRMDTDTTKTKFSHEEILSRFKRGEAKVLVGTQIVTKGHDFPRVTLVGVLNADASLYLDDYRAGERTFAMLTQVIGRAGRADAPGVAVIQTQNPDSEVIQLAAAQDYPSFYDLEIRMRRALVFPPFCDIAVFTLTSADEALLHTGTVRLAELVRGKLAGEFSDVKTVVFGPFEAPIYKVQNNCRMRMVIKCKDNRRTREFLSSVMCDFARKGSRRLTLGVDINPSSL